MLADVLDAGLEDAVRRRIGDHQGGEAVGVFHGLRLEIGEVDVAVGVALDDHDLEAGHDRRGGVGAVRGDRDEADVAVRVAPRLLWYARMTSRPAYSPCEPALGCSETASKPVISATANLRAP
jgi:hypothetical protein